VLSRIIRKVTAVASVLLKHIGIVFLQSENAVLLRTGLRNTAAQVFAKKCGGFIESLTGIVPFTTNL